MQYSRAGQLVQKELLRAISGAPMRGRLFQLCAKTSDPHTSLTNQIQGGAIQ